MNSILGVTIVLSVLFFSFSTLGTMAMKKLEIDVDFCGRGILGFLIFAFVFVLIDVPMEYIQVPFQVLAYTTLAVWLALIGYSIYDSKVIMFLTKNTLSDNTVFGMIVIVGAEIWYGMKNAIYTSYTDAAYYNLSSITAIYTNTIFQYDQFSGLLGNANTRAQDSCIMFVAVLSQISGMHVLVMVNRVMAILEIILFNMLLYEIALLISKNNRKIAFLTIPIYFVLSLFYWSNGGETLLWGRLAETKSMLANVYIPAVLYSFLLLATQKRKGKVWWIIMCAATVGAALSYSGTYIILAYVFFLAVSYWLFHGRKWKDVGYSALSVVPGTVLVLMRTFL